jgi:hypothetical protein
MVISYTLFLTIFEFETAAYTTGCEYKSQHWVITYSIVGSLFSCNLRPIKKEGNSKSKLS